MDSFPDSSEDVLNDLDPLSRALLDLSVQRGMDDAEIAQVLGTDESSVFEVRVGLLRNLAEKVAPEHADADLPELEAAVAERLYPEEVGPEAGPDEDLVPAEDAEPEAEPDLETDEGPDADDDPDDEPEPVAVRPRPAGATAASAAAAAPTRKPTESRRRSLLPIILPILLLVAVAAVIVVVGSGGESDSETSEPAGQEQPQQPEPKADAPKADEPEKPKAEEPATEQPKPTRLTALGSGDATGTVTVDGGRLEMTVRDLADPGGSTYTVWLYDSVIDAEQLTTVKDGKVQAKLPNNADEFEFLDVSLEPRDGNDNHSGQSVLRVPLSKLESR